MTRISFPTCLRISASEPLMLLVKRLLETIGEKSGTIARSARRHGRFRGRDGCS